LKTILAISVLIAGWTLDWPANAQSKTGNPYTDSLLTRVAAAAADSAKARLLFQLSDYWSERDSAQSVQFADRSFQYTPKNSFLRGLAHFYRAGAYFSYDVIKSQQDYLSADSLLMHFSSKEALQYRSRIWHNYGALEQRKDNSEAFVDLILSKAIPYAQAAGDQKRVAWNYMDLGAVFMNYKNYTRASEYYDKAIDILNAAGEPSSLLAECYVQRAKSDILQDSLHIAQVALSQAFQILSVDRDSSYLPVYYLVEGMYHSKRKQWKQAIAALDTGEAIAHQLRRTYDEASIAYEKSQVYKQQGLLGKAKHFLEKAYNLQQGYEISNNFRLLLFELAKTEAALGQHDTAFNRLMEYVQVSDSFFMKRTAVAIADQESKYRVAEKEKELLRLQNRNQVQRLILYFGICLFVLVGAFAFYAYRQRKKREAQRLNAIQQHVEIQVAKAQLQGEEKERQRIARDLHDGLGGLLAGIKLNLSVANHDKQQGEHVELEKIIAQVDDSVHELRRIARNMVPEILIRSGLANAIKDLCEVMTTDKMAITCEILNLSEAIPQQQKIEIYRIVQELLTNAAKHSGATEVFLQCSKVQDHVYITIEDNGRGMSQHVDPKKTNGMGLGNIRSRVAYMQGKIDVHSVPKKGVIVNIEINVAEKK